jgi:adenylate kinase family enzyme
MRIGIVGTTFSGKSTLAKNISYAWPNFTLLECTEDFSKEKKPLLAEFDWWIDRLLENTSDVVFDGCLINVLGKILQENVRGNITNEEVKKSVAMFRQSCRFYDIIFNLQLNEKETPINTFDLTEEELSERKILEDYIQSIFWDWREDKPVFFVHDDRPPFIRIYGDKEEIVATIARDFLDGKGKARTYADDDLQKEMAMTVDEYAAIHSLGGDETINDVLKDLRFNK